MTATGPAATTPADGPVAVVRRYLDEIYHAGDVELVREITAEVLAGDDAFAVLVWTARGRTADRLLSGIEVFRVVDGRITDVWNTPYSTEPWA
ncbi:hypothetical protein [Actinomycetospora chiangmaiensis]|uniref:hypothetical protein n=1 Tax=Actinomycetospora chiangmaiensis TaxID=402650 RepID=UPI000369184E|nr:hypothetical protein [Actinomycetospora chiangmaiensis]